MRIVLIVTLLLVAAMPFFAQDRVSVPDRQVMARIRVETPAEMRQVIDLGLDLMEYREGSDLIFMATQQQVNALLDRGFRVRIDEQLTSELAAQSRPETFGGGYRTVEETYAFLNQIAAQYPKLAEVFTYGQSWEKTQNLLNGYNLTGIKLTNRVNRGTKPRVVIQAGIHARELVPPEMATRFIQYLLTNYNKNADATWLLNDHEIYIIPLFNPDGRKIAETGQMKRKNTNTSTGSCSSVSAGIDLNRNYTFWWGTVNMPSDPPCGETWPGLEPNSEPEIAASQAFIRSLFPDQRDEDRSSPAPPDATGVFLDMHSYGNLVLYPWGEDELPPPNPQFADIAGRMAGYNGYNPIQSINLYPTSGTSHDFSYGELGIAGLAMETGSSGGSCGGFMPPYSCLDGGTGGNFWNLNRPVLIYLAKLARTPFMTGQGPTTETLTSVPMRFNRYSIRAQITDEFNGGQNIAGAEIFIDVPPWRGGTSIAMMPEDGSFNSPVEYAVGNVSCTPGRHTLYVRGKDSAGNWGTITAVFTMSSTDDEASRVQNR